MTCSPEKEKAPPHEVGGALTLARPGERLSRVQYDVGSMGPPVACVKRRAMNPALFPESEPAKPRKKATGPQADACRLWHEAWQRHRGCRFAWSDKDADLVSKALKLAEGSLALLGSRIERLLTEQEDQWLARNAGPGILVSHWNQLAYEPPKKPKVGTPLTYVPCRGPRIPPPPGLYRQFLEAREAALRATAARSTRRSPSSPAG